MHERVGVIEEIKEAFSIFPAWVYILLATVAIVLGRGIRWWLDRGKAREKERIKELQKQEKLRMKRQRKLEKKARKK